MPPNFQLVFLAFHFFSGHKKKSSACKRFHPSLLLPIYVALCDARAMLNFLWCVDRSKLRLTDENVLRFYDEQKKKFMRFDVNPKFPINSFAHYSSAGIRLHAVVFARKKKKNMRYVLSGRLGFLCLCVFHFGSHALSKRTASRTLTKHTHEILAYFIIRCKK